MNRLSSELRRRDSFALGGIVAFGLVLRTIQVGHEALWADEAITLLLGNWPVRQLFFWPVDPTPGVYYALVKLFIPDGAAVFTVRLMPILFGTLSIPAIYLVGRLAMAPTAGLIAAALLAVSFPMIDYSQEGRPYSLLVLLCLTSAVGLLWWLRSVRGGNKDVRALMVFAAGTLIAFYTHFTSVFWILPIVLAGRELTDRQGDRRASRHYLAAMLGMAGLAIPEVWRSYMRAKIFGGFHWLDNPGPIEFLAAVGDIVLPAGFWNGREGALSPWSAAVLAAGLLLIGWRLAVKRRQWPSTITPEGATVIGILIGVPLLVWLFGLAVAPILMPRTLLLAVPGFALLLAWLVVLEGRQWLGSGLVGVFAASLLFSGTIRPREPWPAVVAALRSPVASGEAILVCPEWRAPALRHALGPPARPDLYVLIDKDVAALPPALSGTSWTRNYFSALLTWQVFGKWSMVRRNVAPTPGRFWIIESECRPDQQRYIEHWLGRGTRRVVLDLPETPHHAGIRLSRFNGAAAQRQLMFPPLIQPGN